MVLVQGIIAGFVAGVLALPVVGGSAVYADTLAPAVVYVEDPVPHIPFVPLRTGHCPEGGTDQSDLSLLRITPSRGLPRGYVPAGLVEVPPPVKVYGEVCLIREAALALHSLYADAEADGILLEVYSGYRSPEEQEVIRTKRYRVDGVLALRAVAPPNYSEHQTGTAIDLTGASVGYERARNGFEDTPEYNWLVNHAWKYGFNLSYPKTLRNGEPGEYRFEPWHWRYVGTTTAKRLRELEISYSELPPDTSLSTR